LITEATVRTRPLPKHVGLVLLLFDRLQNAAHAALEIGRMGATACDLMDRRLLSLARELDVRYDVLLPPSAEALLLVEQEGDEPAELRDRLQQITNYVCRRKRLAFESRLALEPDDMQFFWRLAGHVVPALFRLGGAERPLPFAKDIGVPPEALPDFLTRLQNVLKKHKITASCSHAGHGQLHLRPFLDLAKEDDIHRMQQLATDLYQEVLAAHGTISGEHGDGLSRSWFLREPAGPLAHVFREVKNIFDPQNILNPGKIVGDLPQPLTGNLRPVLHGQARELSETGAGPPSPAASPAKARSDEPIAPMRNRGLTPPARPAAVPPIPLQLN
jgi:FAD/FMN-containing dehydrogenase